VTPWRITTDVDEHGVAILGVTGELVTDTASELAAAAVLTGYRVTHLVVDLVRVAGTFASAAPQRYPSDLATFFAYQRALRAIPVRYPIPAPLPVDMFDRFLAGHHHRYPAISAESVG
jgi:hypothetical protein